MYYKPVHQSNKDYEVGKFNEDNKVANKEIQNKISDSYEIH